MRLAICFVLCLTIGWAQGSRPPVALVFEFADRWTKATGLARALEGAGFEVRQLDLTQALETTSVELLAFGSFSTEHEAWQGFALREAAAIQRFVREGGVVLQMTQADQTEARPPFLPKELGFQRTDADLGGLVAPTKEAAQHPLVAGLSLLDLDRANWFGRPASWETAGPATGFEVLLSAKPALRNPVLLEGSHGKGRFLLTSLFFDKLHPSDPDVEVPVAVQAAAATWFAGLKRHVVAVLEGKARPVVPSPEWKEPDPLPDIPGAWTVVVLPDTQVYAARYPHHFEAQTRWIVEQKKKRDIRYVLHLGDIVNDNSEKEWTNARRAMKTLVGEVPFAMAPGNHDYGPGGSARDRSTLLNDFFPYAETAAQPGFGGSFEPGKLDSTFHTFEAGGTKWLMLALEWGPRDPVVAWANEVVARHPDHRVILITHAYMYFDETRYDWAERGRSQSWNPHAYGSANLPGGTNDGQELWDKLVSRHRGFTMTLNGHVLGDGLGRIATKGEEGNLVHQMLVNYQMKREGGEGYLRLLEFHPDGKSVQVRCYSPVTKRFKTDPQNQFVLKLDPPL